MRGFFARMLRSLDDCVTVDMSVWENQVSEQESFEEGARPAKGGGHDHLWEVEQYRRSSECAAR